MDTDFPHLAYTVSTWVLPVIIAITFHEAAHAFVAWYYGDDTAYERGRVTLNPLRHVDLFGTIILPGLLLLSPAPFVFGWAKPVPVAFHRLRHPRHDMVRVAAAGPVMNLLLALVSAILLRLVGLFPETLEVWLAINLTHSILINVILAVFNMLPLPPLDGGRVAVGLLPAPLAIPLARLERYGLFILVGLLFLLPYLSRSLGYDIDILHWLVWQPVNWLLSIFEVVGGLA